MSENRKIIPIILCLCLLLEATRGQDASKSSAPLSGERRRNISTSTSSVKGKIHCEGGDCKDTLSSNGYGFEDSSTSTVLRQRNRKNVGKAVVFGSGNQVPWIGSQKDVTLANYIANLNNKIINTAFTGHGNYYEQPFVSQISSLRRRMVRDREPFREFHSVMHFGKRAEMIWPDDSNISSDENFRNTARSFSSYSTDKEGNDRIIREKIYSVDTHKNSTDKRTKLGSGSTQTSPSFQGHQNSEIKEERQEPGFLTSMEPNGLETENPTKEMYYEPYPSESMKSFPENILPTAVFEKEISSDKLSDSMADSSYDFGEHRITDNGVPPQRNLGDEDSPPSNHVLVKRFAESTPYNSLMHFGKRLEGVSPYNSLMHFGKRYQELSPYNSLMHFGKRSKDSVPHNSSKEFVKKSSISPYNSLMHFGKRLEDFMPSNTLMHFGKRFEEFMPSNTLMHFGKRYIERGPSNSVMHFGKRSSGNEQQNDLIYLEKGFHDPLEISHILDQEKSFTSDDNRSTVSKSFPMENFDIFDNSNNDNDDNGHLRYSEVPFMSDLNRDGIAFSKIFPNSETKGDVNFFDASDMENIITDSSMGGARKGSHSDMMFFDSSTNHSGEELKEDLMNSSKHPAKRFHYNDPYNSVMHFGKRFGESPYNTVMHFGKKFDATSPYNSVMHFGKRFDGNSPYNSVMHFGKRFDSSSPYNSVMHFGKRFGSNSPYNSVMHFGKRFDGSSPYNSVMHFGKRLDGSSPYNSVMHFGKRFDDSSPYNSVMHFGKRHDGSSPYNSVMHFGKRFNGNSPYNSVMHFGKRLDGSSPYNSVMHFGKRSDGSSPYNSVMHFGKRHDGSSPYNSVMHFGKRLDGSSPYNSVMHFGKRFDGSSPYNSVMHFGKRFDGSSPYNSVMHFGKRLDGSSPYNSVMHFGKRYDGSSPHNSVMHFGKRFDGISPYNSLMHFGKRFDGSSPYNSVMHFGKRLEGNSPYNSVMHFGKKFDGGSPYNSVMHFGKRFDGNSPYNSVMHFGKRFDVNSPYNSVMHFGKRFEKSLPYNSLLHFGKRYNSSMTETISKPSKTSFIISSPEKKFNPKGPQNSLMHFGKRFDLNTPSNSLMHFGKRFRREVPFNSVMHFGKRLYSNGPQNSLMHFGKRFNEDSPFNSVMHFGKRFQPSGPRNSLMHFGKKSRTEAPLNHKMNFGKRFVRSGPQNSLMHFGKRFGDQVPFNSVLHFRKRLDERGTSNFPSYLEKKLRDAPFNSVMHFGKRYGPQNSLMHFGKRFSETSPFNSVMHFGKRSTMSKPHNSLMHFGKKLDYREPYNSVMHFGKRSEVNEPDHSEETEENDEMPFPFNSKDFNEISDPNTLSSKQTLKGRTRNSKAQSFDEDYSQSETRSLPGNSKNEMYDEREPYDSLSSSDRILFETWGNPVNEVTSSDNSASHPDHIKMDLFGNQEHKSQDSEEDNADDGNSSTEDKVVYREKRMSTGSQTISSEGFSIGKSPQELNTKAAALPAEVEDFAIKMSNVPSSDNIVKSQGSHKSSRPVFAAHLKNKRDSWHSTFGIPVENPEENEKAYHVFPHKGKARTDSKKPFAKGSFQNSPKQPVKEQNSFSHRFSEDHEESKLADSQHDNSDTTNKFSAVLNTPEFSGRGKVDSKISYSSHVPSNKGSKGHQGKASKHKTEEKFEVATGEDGNEDFRVSSKTHVIDKRTSGSEFYAFPKHLVVDESKAVPPGIHKESNWALGQTGTNGDPRNEKENHKMAFNPLKHTQPNSNRRDETFSESEPEDVVVSSKEYDFSDLGNANEYELNPDGLEYSLFSESYDENYNDVPNGNSDVRDNRLEKRSVSGEHKNPTSSSGAGRMFQMSNSDVLKPVLTGKSGTQMHKSSDFAMSQDKNNLKTTTAVTDKPRNHKTASNVDSTKKHNHKSQAGIKFITSRQSPKLHHISDSKKSTEESVFDENGRNKRAEQSGSASEISEFSRKSASGGNKSGSDTSTPRQENEVFSSGSISYSSTDKNLVENSSGVKQLNQEKNTHLDGIPRMKRDIRQAYTERKRYWGAPFQGAKSMVYPPAWLASQIRRSNLPIELIRSAFPVSDIRLAEKKEVPMNSFLHFG